MQLDSYKGKTGDYVGGVFCRAFGCGFGDRLGFVVGVFGVVCGVVVVVGAVGFS